jgi:hypothetical protein
MSKKDEEQIKKLRENEEFKQWLAEEHAKRSKREGYDDSKD